jgi:hypothetical protein
MLKVGKFSCSCFVFQEHGYRAQEFRIPQKDIDSGMIVESRFRLPEFPVHLQQKHAMVYGKIRFETGQECPLSGFPKTLVHTGNRKPGNSHH